MFKHLTGEHLCPRDDTEFYTGVGIFMWLVFMWHCSTKHAEAYSDVHVRLQLNRVLRECVQEGEEDAKKRD